MNSQSEQNGATPHHYAFEYPDAAGYPDGTGTLDEGTRESDAVPDSSEFDQFLDGDSRDS
jgi:hypothetical protein